MATEVISNDLGLNFDQNAKKRKKKKKTPFTGALALEGANSTSSTEEVATTDKSTTGPTAGPTAGPTSGSSSSPSSSSSSSSSSSASAASSSSSGLTNNGSSESLEKDYSYEELVDRIFMLMESKNPELFNKSKDQRMRVPAPALGREGTKKTVWINFQDTADALGRAKEHLQAYALAELGTSGTLDSESRLTIRGRFQSKQLQTVVRHYITDYVICQTCKSSETCLKKENRLFFLQCQHCNSKRSVAAIKQGYVAQVGRRRRN